MREIIGRQVYATITIANYKVNLNFSYTPDTWQSNYPSDRFANIVYAVSNASEMRELVQKAVGSNVGAFFVTSDTLPNPYDTLPDYWTEEVSEFGAQ